MTLRMTVFPSRRIIVGVVVRINARLRSTYWCPSLRCPTCALKMHSPRVRGIALTFLALASAVLSAATARTCTLRPLGHGRDDTNQVRLVNRSVVS